MSHFGLLLELKLAEIRNSLGKLFRRSRTEFATLFLFLTAAAAGLFFFFHTAFQFFRGQEPFGPILINETFYLLNFSLFFMLVLSSGVSAYASLFRSREVPFLLTRPVTWTEIYFLKLTEALWHSSWSILFITLPFMTAYGLAKAVNPFLFSLYALLFYLPLIVLAAILGTLASVLLVWLLPSPGRRRAAFLLVILTITLIFTRTEPEFVKEQGSVGGILTGYLPQVAFAKHPLIPSTWLSKGVLAVAGTSQAPSAGLPEGLFYFLVLLSNALFLLVPSFSAARGLFATAYLKAQDHGEASKPRKVRFARAMARVFDSLPWPSRPALAFLEKDLKTFARDPSEWSQLLIFFGLLLFYFINLKNFQFHILKDFWKHLVFVLNTIGTYIVLSSFSMRFVFPMLSLEGSKAWILGLAPIRFSSLLLEKFLLGLTLSALLTLPLVFLSGWMLGIPLRQVVYTTGLGFFVCVALTGLSVGLGARFINFQSNNPSEIISGFGGSMLLMTHLGYLALVGVFLMCARDPQGIVFALMAAGSLLVGMLSLKAGVRAMEKMEF